MPTVSLHKHSYITPLQDVLRLFYGPVSLNNDQCFVVGDDAAVEIRSEIMADGRVRTSLLQRDFGSSAVNTGAGMESAADQAEIVSRHDLLDEIAVKREIKRQLYYVLSKYTGIHYPWGSLTGIRPTYVAKQLLDSGSYESARQALEEHYFVSPEKADLALETTLEEERLLELFPKNDLAIYIGIPFCPTRCSYCSFSTYEGIGRPNDEMNSYVDALVSELKLVWTNESFLKNLSGKVRALYVGGGTPTALTAGQLQRLFGELNALPIPWAESCEWTVEAGRPDTIDREKLEIIRDGGFTRISINPQSMQDDTLKRIGRFHSSQDIRDCFNQARRLGFEDINMDLIAGLEGEDAEAFSYSLREVIALAPDSVSVHNLAVKRSSRLHRQLTERYQKRKRLGIVEPPGSDLYAPDEAVADMLREARSALEVKGYRPYYLYRSKDGVGSLENTSYAKEGKACLYNVAMMGDARSILSFGAGSISKRIVGGRLERSPNLKNILEYNKRVAEMADRKLELWNGAND